MEDSQQRAGSPMMTIDGGTGGAQNSPGSSLTRQEFSTELRKTCDALRTDLINDIQELLGNRFLPCLKELIDGRRPSLGIDAAVGRPGFSKPTTQLVPSFWERQTSQASASEVDAKDSKLRAQGEIKDVATMPETPKDDSGAVSSETLVVPKKNPKKSADILEAWKSDGSGGTGADKGKESGQEGEKKRSSWMVRKTPTMQSLKHNYSRTASFYNQVTAEESIETGGGFIYNLVSSDYFDYVMGAILVLNALAIGVQVDVMARSKSTEPDTAFRVIDLIFCIVFTIELALRIFAFGLKRFLTMNGWRWNLFDVLIVSFGLVDEITKLALSGSEVQEVIDSLGVLRMLRLGRILRLVRMVRLIPALKSMVYLIAASMLSFFWTGVLLIIFMYCVAVYFTELCTEFVHKQTSLLSIDANGTSINPNLDFVELKQQWGSVGLSVMSLFQAITGGDDWKNLVSGFKAENENDATYTLNIVILSLYIAFAMLVMLNLVTGVFVEGAQKISGEEKEAELVRTVRKLVGAIDGDGNGDISWEEFEEHMDDQLMQDFLKGFDMDSNQARDIFQVLDRDSSGTVTLDEFISATISLRGPTKMADTEVLKYGLLQSFSEVHKRLDSFEQALANIPRLQEQQQQSFANAPIIQAPAPHGVFAAPHQGMLTSHPLDGYPRVFFVGTTETEV